MKILFLSLNMLAVTWTVKIILSLSCDTISLSLSVWRNHKGLFTTMVAISETWLLSIWVPKSTRQSLKREGNYTFFCVSYRHCTLKGVFSVASALFDMHVVPRPRAQGYFQAVAAAGPLQEPPTGSFYFHTIWAKLNVLSLLSGSQFWIIFCCAFVLFHS